MAACEDCGRNAGFMASVCGECIDKRNRTGNRPEEKAAQAAHEEAVEKAAPNIIVTTAPSLDGMRVVETVDVVTSECVFGMNIFRDLFAGVSDLFGGRNKSSQKVLRDARVTCLNELRREAAMVGANAVIAVDLDYSEFSGGGKSMLFLVASGTAVKVEKAPPA